MATLVDIAKELNISVSLVSKVLNNRLGTTGARPELIESIRKTAEKMDYQKNSSALALRTGRHNAVGIFIHQFGRPGCGSVDSLLQGVAAEAKQCNQRFILDYFQNTDEFMAFKEFMNRSTMDGLLLGGLIDEDKDLEGPLLALKAAGMPVVTIFDKPISPVLPNVSFDQIAMGRIATEHLIQRGCRRIAHIVDFDDRYQGYCAALIQEGLPIDEKLIYQEGGAVFSYNRGCRAADFLLDSKTDFDGIVTQSDEEAMGVINVLMERGLRVPEDVRIIGMDNAPYCKFSPVPLSSVSQSGGQRGRIAFEMLMNLIDGKSAESVTISPRLFARESTA